MKQKSAYYSLKLFLFFGRILPKKWIYSFCRWLLERYYSLKPKRVEIMHANIKRAFPEMSSSQIKEFGMSVYEELAKTISEVMLISADRFDIKASVVNAESTLKRLEVLEKSTPNGIVFIMAHYGNWELLGHWMALHGHTLIGVVKDGKNKLIDRKILLPFRGKYGNISVPHKGSMLTLAKALKAGKSISLAIDQVVQPPNGVVVDFFGHATAATKAIAVLKKKYNPLVVPIFIERVGFEKFEIKLGDPIEPTPEIYTDKQKQIEDMTQCYYDVIEKQIRSKPEQWLWMYNRWKRIKGV